MSDLIEIKLSAEVADDSMSKIKEQFAELEKSVKIKPDMDTTAMSKTLKGIEKDIDKISGGKGKKLEIFNEAELRKSGLEVVKVKDSIEKSMKDIENSYKKMGETSIGGQKFDPVTKEVEQFTVKVKEAEGVTKNYTYTVAELEGAQKAWVQTGITGTENQIKSVKDLLTQKDKLLTVERQLDNSKKNLVSLDPQSQEYKKLSAEAERLRDVQKEYNKSLETIDSTKIKQLQTDMNQYRTDLNKAVKEVPQVQNISVDKFGGDMQKVGRNMIALAAPVLAVGGAAIKASVDFESSFAGIKKTVDATEEEFAVLEKSVREMAKSFPQSASEIAKVGEIAGQLGIAKEEIMDFTKVMTMLGDTTNMTSESAATDIARFANITNMSADNYERLGSVIVDLGKVYCPATWKQVA